MQAVRHSNPCQLCVPRSCFIYSCCAALITALRLGVQSLYERTRIDLRWSGDTTSSSVRLVGYQVAGVHLLEHLAGHQVVYRKQSQHMLVWMRSHELAGHSWNRHRSQLDYLRNYSARCLALRCTCGLHIVIFLALQFTAFASAHRWCGCWLCAIVAPFKSHTV